MNKEKIKKIIDIQMGYTNNEKLYSKVKNVVYTSVYACWHKNC
ncbi:hypothetical protein [uncultured Clostridium sp.]|nr:hypothetical protein [uncultured Clostridium sp.]